MMERNARDQASCHQNRLGERCQSSCRELYTARTGLGDAFRAAMDIDKPTGGGALDGSAHTETLAELLAVGEKQ